MDVSNTASWPHPRARRALVAAYGAAAILLLPWIAALLVDQTPTGVTENPTPATIGVVVLLAVGLLVAAYLARRPGRLVVVVATVVGVVSLVTAFLHTVIRTGTPDSPSVLPALSVFGVVGAFCAWLVISAVRGRGAGSSRWNSLACIVLAGGLVLLIPRLLHHPPHTQIANHLRLAWAGLDALEVVALAGVALALHRQSPGTSIPAAAAGALLFSDAWFNVLATNAALVPSALVMAAIELPLAVLSVTVSVRLHAARR